MNILKACGLLFLALYRVMLIFSVLLISEHVLKKPTPFIIELIAFSSALLSIFSHINKGDDLH